MGELFTRGLCLMEYVYTVREVKLYVQWFEVDDIWHGEPAKSLILRTPVGEVSQISVEGGYINNFFKNPGRLQRGRIYHTRHATGTWRSGFLEIIRASVRSLSNPGLDAAFNNAGQPGR
jgi:hypothetical protein